MEWSEAITEIMQTVIYVGLPILVGFIVKTINSFFNLFKEKTANEQIQRQLENAESAVENAVNYVSQTYVNELKRQESFGIDAQKIAFEKTKMLAVDMINTESQSLIQGVYGEFDTWLKAKIESTVAKNHLPKN